MATRLVSVVIDSVDPPTLAAWWANALGWRFVACTDGDAAVVPDGGHVDDLSLLFVKVADLSRGKNRVHLDLGSRSPTHQQELVEQLVDAGANRLDVGQDDVSWVVLADPEDNALCVLAPDDRFDPAPALAAIAIDARQPGALAAFWARATGWHVESSSHLIASLCHPSGLPPSLDLLAVDEPTPGKNRVHLDVAPGADGDRAVEVARLERAGARPADVGQGSEVPWTVLTDPDGNEFCVLDPR